MTGLLIGYARVSTEEQDLIAQRDGLAALGVEPSRIYVDHGLTGANRERPGLREALAACRAGDTLVVTKLDRLARSLPDARAIAEDLTTRKVRLSLGASVYDPTGPVGRLLFSVLAMEAAFEADLIRSRTREGMRVAKARAICEASSPSSTRARKRTWSSCCALASTPRQNVATCSAWPLHRLPSRRPQQDRRRRSAYCSSSRPASRSVVDGAGDQRLIPTGRGTARRVTFRPRNEASRAPEQCPRPRSLNRDAERPRQTHERHREVSKPSTVGGSAYGVKEKGGRPREQASTMMHE